AGTGTTGRKAPARRRRRVPAGIATDSTWTVEAGTTWARTRAPLASRPRTTTRQWPSGAEALRLTLRSGVGRCRPAATVAVPGTVAVKLPMFPTRSATLTRTRCAFVPAKAWRTRAPAPLDPSPKAHL